MLRLVCAARAGVRRATTMPPLPSVMWFGTKSAAATGPSTTPRKALSALNDEQLRGKRVFVRVDFNVPLSKKDGSITDDTRIRESLGTIETLAQRGARVILASHLGRPKGTDDKLRMKPIAARLNELLRAKNAGVKNVAVADDCIGAGVSTAAHALRDGQVLLLENVRFHKEEEKNDLAFAKEMARATGAEVYVNDAFGTAHRAHASTAGIRAFIAGPAVAGHLMQKELTYLYHVRDDPHQPFVAVMGGAKVADKITVIEAMMNKTKTLIIGGGMAFPFLKARGHSVGASKCDDENVTIARTVLATAASKAVNVVLPVDAIIAQAFANDSPRKVVELNEHDTGSGSGGIPDGWIGLDIGPKTVSRIAQELSGARTVFWNGPMGVFEMPNFAHGTLSVAKAIATLSTGRGTNEVVTIVGGGDSVAAVAQAGVTDSMTHISTGGGAALELLEGAVLPGVEALDPID